VILEGVVTTVDEAGVLNVAPMGPKVDPEMRTFVLRPYRTSTTYRNVKASGEGVFHVTDDVLLIARTAIGLPPDADTRPAGVVRGRVLVDACRYYEFRVTELDDREERTNIVVEAVAEGRLRDFFGLNRGKHAVVEAAILATRLAWLGRDEVLREFAKLGVLVEKTGGPAEHQAFRLLSDFVGRAGARHDLDPDGGRP
jgi:hypothetical protein